MSETSVDFIEFNSVLNFLGLLIMNKVWMHQAKQVIICSMFVHAASCWELFLVQIWALLCCMETLDPDDHARCNATELMIRLQRRSRSINLVFLLGRNLH